jgi:hypothetical protein
MTGGVRPPRANRAARSRKTAVECVAIRLSDHLKTAIQTQNRARTAVEVRFSAAC